MDAYNTAPPVPMPMPIPQTESVANQIFTDLLNSFEPEEQTDIIKVLISKIRQHRNETVENLMLKLKRAESNVEAINKINN